MTDIRTPNGSIAEILFFQTKMAVIDVDRSVKSSIESVLNKLDICFSKTKG